MKAVCPRVQPPHLPPDHPETTRQVSHVEKSALHHPSYFRCTDSTPWPDFQLQYARREWAKEKATWRAVIFFNLIRNIIDVLDVLLREMSRSDGDRHSASPGYISDNDWEPSPHPPVYRFTDKHRLLKLRLAPLRRVQIDLEKRLGPVSQEIYTCNPLGPVEEHQTSQVHPREFGIISSNGWKSALEKLQVVQKGSTYPQPVLRRREEENYEIADVLVGCRENMKTLWDDDVVQQILTHRKARIEDSPGL